MRYLLDSNICVYAMKNRPLQVLRRLQNIGPRGGGGKRRHGAGIAPGEPVPSATSIASSPHTRSLGT